MFAKVFSVACIALIVAQASLSTSCPLSTCDGGCGGGYSGSRVITRPIQQVTIPLPLPPVIPIGKVCTCKALAIKPTVLSGSGCGCGAYPAPGYPAPGYPAPGWPLPPCGLGPLGPLGPLAPLSPYAPLAPLAPAAGLYPAPLLPGCLRPAPSCLPSPCL